MAGINTEIENLKNQIERIQQNIENQYMELGAVAGEWHDVINYEPSNEPYAELCSLIKVKDDIEGQINAVHEALKEVNSSDQEIAKTQLSMKDLDNHYNILIAKLGAVANEVDSEGRLPENLYKNLEPIKEYEKKLNALESSRNALDQKKNVSQFRISNIEKKIARHKDTLNDVFFEAGRRLLNSGDYKYVPGQKAISVIHEMREVESLKKNYHGLIKESETNITRAQGELKNMGAYGEESKMLKTLEAKDKQVLGQLEVKFMEYGKVLSQGMNEWLTSDAPRDIKDVCKRIRMSNINLMQQNLKMDYLMLEREIEIHKSQNGAYVTQMEHLSNQRIQIDRQMAEVQGKMNEEKSAIEALKQKQTEITRNAEQLEMTR